RKPDYSRGKTQDLTPRNRFQICPLFNAPPTTLHNPKAAESRIQRLFVWRCRISLQPINQSNKKPIRNNKLKSWHGNRFVLDMEKASA
ncbi:hypothetical protein, partial [Marinobacter sp. ELB17]|uniref:hypothetical protein n=1 Tax=Marinobacter sp. ELB17 TaxID=270374 RepID=UPI001D0D42AE